MKCGGCGKTLDKECVYCHSDFDEDFQIFCCDGVAHVCGNECLASFVKEEYSIDEVDIIKK